MLRSIARTAIINFVSSRPISFIGRFIRQNYFSVITYHWVGNGKPDLLRDTQGISEEEFESQIEYLNKYYHVVSLDEIANTLTSPIANKNQVAITFDDGYSCIAEKVDPILQRHKTPATVFLSGKLINNSVLLWRHSLKLFAARGDWHIFLNELSEIVGYPIVVNPSAIGQYELERQFPFDLLSLACSMVHRKLNQEEEELAKANSLYMSTKQIESLDNRYWTIGHHTISHSFLSTLSIERQESEIKEGLDYVLQFGPLSRNYFAIPFGNKMAFNNATIQAARKLNCELILTSIRGFEKKPTSIILKRFPAPDNARDLRSYLTDLHPDMWYIKLFGKTR